MKLPISAIILTYNEEKNIEYCLNSIVNWVDEIFIVDSYSKDKTLNIAKKFTDKIFKHTFETHSSQWNWALQELPLKNEWIIGLDADQVILEELVDEISNLFNSGRIDDFDGYYIKRKQFFMGRWIRHGGYYPRYLLKLFKNKCVYIDTSELMDHHFYVKGRTSKLQYGLIENNRNETLDFWIDKHNKYSTMQAKEDINAFNKKDINIGSILGNQDEKRLKMKQIWQKSPLFSRSLLYFLYRYIFLKGFLDGKEGLIFHFLQAFWYRFLVDAKIYERMNEGD